MVRLFEDGAVTPGTMRPGANGFLVCSWEDGFEAQSEVPNLMAQPALPLVLKKPAANKGTKRAACDQASVASTEMLDSEGEPVEPEQLPEGVPPKAKGAAKAKAKAKPPKPKVEADAAAGAAVAEPWVLYGKAEKYTDQAYIRAYVGEQVQLKRRKTLLISVYLKSSANYRDIIDELFDIAEECHASGNSFEGTKAKLILARTEILQR